MTTWKTTEEAAVNTLSPADPTLTLDDCAALVRAEYYEIPDLIMSRDEMESLLDIDAGICGEIIEILLASKFLTEIAPDFFARERDNSDDEAVQGLASPPAAIHARF